MKSRIFLLFLALVLLQPAFFAFAAGTGADIQRFGPDVAYDPFSQQYLVVYSFQEYDSGGVFVQRGIRGQLFDNLGRPFDPEIDIALDQNEGYGGFNSPSVAFSQDRGMYLVVWGENRTGGPQEIWGQLVGADGQPYTPGVEPLQVGIDNFRVSPESENWQNNPDVAWDWANDRFLAVWEAPNPEVNDFPSIYGHLIGSDGLSYTSFVVSDRMSGQYRPAVAFDSTNLRFLVVWPGDFSDMYMVPQVLRGQFINADGSPYSTTTSENFIISDAPRSDYANLDPDVAFEEASGHFLVVWNESMDGESNDIYGQIIDSEGGAYSTATWQNFPISIPGPNENPGQKFNPAVATDLDNNRFAVVWEDNSGYQDNDIYGQIVDSNGDLLFYEATQNILVAAGPPNNEDAPALAHGESFLVVYGQSDYETGSDDIGWIRTNNALSTLVGWWPINEGTGDTLFDHSGYENHATSFNSYWAADLWGQWGQAVYFDGAAWAEVPDAPELNLAGPFTVSAWINPEDTMQDSIPRKIVAKSQGGAFAWALEQHGGEVQFSLSDDGSMATAQAIGYGLEPGKWSLVTGVWDGENIRVLINGVTVGGPAPFEGPLFQSNAPLTFGTGSGFFKGLIDDVRIWSAPLSDTQAAFEGGLTGVIEGRVDNDQYTGIADVAVIAQNKNMEWQTAAVTDTNGNYQLNVFPGCYEVFTGNFSLPKEYQIPPTQCLFVNDEFPSWVGFTLQPLPYTISGRVTQDGSPVEGIEVFYHGSNNVNTGTWTQPDGTYLLEGLPRGEAQVGVRPESYTGFAPDAIDVNLTVSLTNVDFALEQGATLEGVVLDAFNNPVPGVTVEAFNERVDVSRQTWTGTDGSFVLQGVAPGKTGVMAHADMGRLLSGSPEKTVYLASGEYKSVGALVMQPGTIVYGTVINAYYELMNCAEVFAQGTDFTADSNVCNGSWAMVMPEGNHRIFLEPEDEQGLPYPMAACPVDVMVMQEDVAGGNAVMAPPILVRTGEAPPTWVSVTVPENTTWVDPPEGRLLALAYPMGSFGYPLTPDVLTRVEPSNGVEILAPDTPYEIIPLCPEYYDIYLVWSFDDPSRPESYTILDVAYSVEAFSGEIPVQLNLPEVFAPLVTGRVLDGFGAPIEGAWVLVNDDAYGFAGYAMTDEAGCYTFVNMPAPADPAIFEAQAFVPGLAGNPAVQFNIQTGQNSLVDDLVFEVANKAGLRIIQTFTVGTTHDEWDGQGKNFPVQTHYGVYFAGTPLAPPEILSPLVQYTPGYAVENVFGHHEWDSDGWDMEETIPPDIVGDPNTNQAYYEWFALPDQTGSDQLVGFFAVDSASTATAMPFTLTRTYLGTAEAGAYSRWVSLEVEVHDFGIEQLHLDIFAQCAPIADVWFDPATPGEDESGPLQFEHYDDKELFTRHTISQPQPGQVYLFKKLLAIEPFGNDGPVDYISRTRVQAEYAQVPVPHGVNGSVLTINDIDAGEIVVSPTNQVEWDASLMVRVPIKEVEQDAFVSEQGAQRAVILSPQPQRINHPVDAPLVIEFSKSMNTDSLILRIWDQWGNVVFDSIRGPFDADITWSSTALENDTATVSFWEDLAPGRAYQVQIAARDEAGYAINPVGSFQGFATATQVGSDVGGPVVMAALPFDGAQGVPVVSPRAFRSKWIMAVFSEAVRPDTLDGIEIFELDGYGGNTLGAALESNVQWSGSRVALLPNAPLAPQTWHRVIIPVSVTDLYGNTLAETFTWDFKTANAPEIGPELYFELDGATSVDRKNPALVFTSSADLDPATLVPGNISITDSGQNDITAFFAISYLTPARGIRLTPKPEYTFSALEPGETYTVSFNADVKDTSGASPANAPKEFSFTTALPHANMRPQIWSLGEMPSLPPYPYMMTTPEILYYDMAVSTSDPDVFWPGETLSGTGTLGFDTFDFDDIDNKGGLFVYQTELLPPGEGAAPGEDIFTFTLADSTDRQAQRSHPVVIFNGTPQLVEPQDGAFSAWPPTVSWQPHPDAKAYIVEVCDDFSCERVFGSFLLPDDQRSEDYSLTLPEELPYPGDNMAWWQVIALANVDDSNAPWGGAVSPVRQVFADDTGPALAAVSPSDGLFEVEPNTPISVDIWDSESSIDVASIQMLVNNLPVPGAELAIDDSDPSYVTVTWEHPNQALTAGMLYTVQLVCQDLAGNPLGQPDSFSFTVRGNTVLEVPFAFGTIQAAADSATAGDVILIEQGDYWQETILGPQHSGISIQGSGVRETVVRGTGIAASVFALEGASNVTISGLTIEGGFGGGVYIAEIEGFAAVNNLVERTIIRNNGAFGVAIEAGGENSVINCLIAQNVLGIAVKRSTVAGAQDPTPLLVSNSIVENTADGVYIENASPNIYYNIVAHNAGFGIADYSNSPVLGYNNVFDNTFGNYFGVAPGGGDISVDPLYPGGAEPQPWPWLPGAASQVIDALPENPLAGSPAYPVEDLRGVSRPQGASPDMGCYENSETPTPPEPVEDVGGEYVAMEGRPLSVAFTSTNEYPGGISFGFAQEPPAGVTFEQPMPGQSPGYLTWTPTGINNYGSYDIYPQVSTAGSQVAGEPVTISVVPALTLTPIRSTALILGAGQEREASPIDCTISGGTAPYSVTLLNGDGTVAQLDGLVDGSTQGSFSFAPLSALPAEDNPVYIRITDSSFMPGFAAAPESFELVSGAFGVNQIFLTHMADLFIDPLQDETLVVEDGLLTGMTIDIPAGSLAEGVTITVYEVYDGAPHIGGDSPAVVNFSPDGTEFALPVSVIFPIPSEFEYGAGRTINDLVALYFDAELGRWQFVPIEFVDDVNNQVGFDTNHFSLYTLALPEFVGFTLDPGTQVSDYRMVCFPVNPAANDSVRGLLEDPANLGTYDDRYWRLFAFDPAAFATGDPNQYFVEATAIDFDDRFPLSPAQAFWAISRNGGPVSIPGLTADNAADYQITLVPGWNMIGNPYTDKFVDFTKVLTFDGENWYLQSNVGDINNPLRNETLYGFDGTGDYQAEMLMAPNTAYWVYSNAQAPVTLKIPVDALTAQVGEKAQKTWFARLLERGERLLTGAMADAVVRQPPPPPGSGGYNTGTHADSIGVHTSAASGSGFCFVGAASQNRGPGLLLAMAAFALALLAVAGTRTALRKRAGK